MLELAQTAQLGMVVNDAEVMKRASEECARDPDVVGLSITVPNKLRHASWS